MPAIPFERAIEVFVRGFCFSRSYTHPYTAERIDGAWVMRDAQNRRSYSRVEEFVAHRIAPADLAALARSHARGHFRICAMRIANESDSEIRGGFRALGYRLMATEAFMAHPLIDIPDMESPIPIVRVETADQVAVLHRETRRRQILPEHLESNSPPIRQYMAVHGERAIAWAASIVVGNVSWCSNVFVNPQYRRRGIAKALLSRLLMDDRNSGAVANVLLASHAGALLYPVVGYQTIGELLMYTPPRTGKGI